MTRIDSRLPTGPEELERFVFIPLPVRRGPLLPYNAPKEERRNDPRARRNTFESAGRYTAPRQWRQGSRGIPWTRAEMLANL
jgi:hypothetical protein